MVNDTQKQFVTALNYFLNKEGRGSQARLAKTLGIDRSYLNAIVKGRSPGPQEKKDKIAAYFNLHYESMLSLGRWILSGGGNQPGETWQPTDSIEHYPPLITPESSPEKLEKDTLLRTAEHSSIYEFSSRDKKDKNMRLVAEWINQQDEPEEYWTLVKIILKREEPAFREWLKKQSSGDNRGRFPENKSVVGE